ncbi:hypothetical protein HHI36_001747 [Cryptolaemus montrouzieri]|uniref:Uncharacterized protein n=1 Tax=Cryptolaemus montrouzieri TaxID=559131 RepID=A0ABD2P9A4_9CUCU
MHIFEKITHDHSGSIFDKAYTRVAKMEEALKEFEVTGIYLMNSHIFYNEDILTADQIIEEKSWQVSQSGVENVFIAPVISHDKFIHNLPSSPSISDRLNENTSHTPRRQTYQNPFDMFAEETTSSIQFTANDKPPSASTNESFK